MTYPIAFRAQVLKIRKCADLSYEQTATRFGVSVASIMRWARRLEPKLKRVKAATKIDRQALAQEVQAHPDAYQYEGAQRFGVSQSGIGCALHRLKISYKKTLAPPALMRRQERMSSSGCALMRRPTAQSFIGMKAVSPKICRAATGMQRAVNVAMALTAGKLKEESMSSVHCGTKNC